MVAIDVRSLIQAEKRNRQADGPCDASDQTSRASATRSSCNVKERHPPGNAALDVQFLRQAYTVAPALSLKDAAVGTHRLKGLFYVPNYITEAETQAVQQCIDASPAGRWVHAGERRMQNWGGRPGEAAVREALPPFVQALVDGLLHRQVYGAAEAPNHCLINDYRNGAGIPAHTDGPLYLDKVATITLGGPALIAFRSVQADGLQGNVVAEVLLRPRCLLVASGPAYRCLHSIESRTQDPITDRCVNQALANCRTGDCVQRANRRVSLVFVTKINS